MKKKKNNLLNLSNENELRDDVLKFVKKTGTTQAEMENRYYTLPKVWPIVDRLIREKLFRHVGNIFYKIA